MKDTRTQKNKKLDNIFILECKVEGSAFSIKVKQGRILDNVGSWSKSAYYIMIRHNDKNGVWKEYTIAGKDDVRKGIVDNSNTTLISFKMYLTGSLPKDYRPRAIMEAYKIMKSRVEFFDTYAKNLDKYKSELLNKEF